MIAARVARFARLVILGVCLAACGQAAPATASEAAPVIPTHGEQQTPGGVVAAGASLAFDHTAYLPFVARATEIWRPAVGASWQWQLAGEPVDVSIAAQVYDIDLFETDAALVADLHARGRRVICYLSAGSWEEYRPDAGAFPAQVIGADYEGWPGEKWLDIRRIDLLAPLMRARLDLCQAKGFDAVEPDNIDGYINNTGFPLTAQDQLAYNRWLATEAHTRGLSIGLKNDSEQTADLLADFDWALSEDCFDQGWCADFSPFIAAGKSVFAAEYTDTGVRLAQICPQAAALQFSLILKHRQLDAFRQTCP